MSNTKSENKSEKIVNYIPLTENYYFTANPDMYTLVQKVTKNRCEGKTRIQTGETYEAYDIIGFYTSLSSLINGCVTQLNRQSIESGEITTLKDCVKQIVNTRQQIIDILDT